MGAARRGPSTAGGVGWAVPTASGWWAKPTLQSGDASRPCVYRRRDVADELKRLQAEIDEALKTRLGYAKEQRGFHPHLTIGRVKRELPGAHGQLAELVEKNAHFDADLAIIDEVVTFASFLGRGGPKHDALDHAELGTRRDKALSL